MKEIIYLPIFSGFYNTIHDFDDSYLIDNFREDNEELCKDYKQYYLDYSKEYVNQFNETYWEEFKKIGINSIEYKSLYSPKEYNYWSDEINVEVDYDFDKIVEFLKTNKEEFTKYIEVHNKSYDWFIPYGTDEFDKYIEDDFEAFELTQIMDFYIIEVLKQETDDFIELHYGTVGNISESDYLVKVV